MIVMRYKGAQQEKKNVSVEAVQAYVLISSINIYGWQVQPLSCKTTLKMKSNKFYLR